MTKESWEEAHDYYYDNLESEDSRLAETDYEGLDDIEEWKEEEQKIIDELIQRMQGAYNDV